jgi:hypothetical protein
MSMSTAYPYKSDTETAPEPGVVAGLYEQARWGRHHVPIEEFRSDDFVKLEISRALRAWITRHYLFASLLPAVSGTTPKAATFEATTYGSNATTASVFKDPESYTASLGRHPAYVIDDPLEGYDQYSSPNWDGFDAEPITPETLNCARKILRELPNTFGEAHIAPGADGSIGFYWSADKGSFKSLCIDVGPGQKWRAYWQLRDGRFDRLPSQRFDDTTGADLAGLFHKLSL